MFFKSQKGAHWQVLSLDKSIFRKCFLYVQLTKFATGKLKYILYSELTCRMLYTSENLIFAATESVKILVMLFKTNYYS